MPVKTSETLHTGDVLYFSGDTATIDYVFKLTASSAAEGPLCEMPLRVAEAVIPKQSALCGDTLKNSRFRSRDDAAVIAIYRNGIPLLGKLGEHHLHSGDVLLFAAGDDFYKNLRHSRDILLISDKAPDATLAPPIVPRWKKVAPFIILTGVIFAVVAGYTSMFQAAVAASCVILVSRIVTPSEVLTHIEWSVLIVIACSFGIANAIEASGLATAIGKMVVVHIGSYGIMAGLLAILTATCITTEFLSHNATAALMFPLAMAVAQQFGTDPRAFAIAVTIGASAGFAVPFAYQTHLMVYGPGGYRFRDFLTVGIPLDIIYIIAGTLLIPLIW